MKTKKYVEYMVEETKKILAIDSPSGYTADVADYVIEGQLEVTIEEKVMVLNPGDSIYFDSRKSHCFRSLNNEPAKFLCIII